MLKIEKGLFSEKKAKLFSTFFAKKFIRKGFSEKLLFGEEYSKFFREETDCLSEKIYRRIKRSFQKTFQDIKIKRNTFEAELNKKWAEPFQLLDVFIFHLSEICDIFNEDRREIARTQKDHVFESLIRISARACKTGREILALLEKGYADGAFARWRTLHELAVTALFIQRNGDEVAEQYLLH